jgi:hypothetical protein
MSQWGFPDPFPAAGDNGFLNFNLDDRIFFNQDRPTPNPSKVPRLPPKPTTRLPPSKESTYFIGIINRRPTLFLHRLMALISIDGSIERTSKIFFLDSRVRAAQQQRMRM